MIHTPFHLIHQIFTYCKNETILYILEHNSKYRNFLTNNKFFLNEILDICKEREKYFNIFDKAAYYGYLNIIQWLHSNQIEGCTTNAMKYAAYYGHLHVIEWLHSNRTEGCTDDAMNIAALNGHLDVVA